MHHRKLPSSYQLMLPLFEELSARGGTARPSELYDPIAKRIDLAPELRHLRQTFADGQSCNIFERSIRWARQTAVSKNREYIAKGNRGSWELTDKGANALSKVTPGIVLTVFETERGRAVLSHAEDARAVIDQNSVSLIFTSPPYPVNRAMPYQHGEDRRSDPWLDQMLRLAEGWHDFLTPDGSLMVNLGYVFNKGVPTQDLYVEKFTIAMCEKIGFHLADRLFWHNPHKLPGMAWVAVRRVRCRATVEPVIWFSKSATPKANNRNVLQPYAPSTLAWRARTSGEKHRRANGHVVNEAAFAVDNGGSIPSNLITATPQPPNSVWRNECKDLGIPVHPATMPTALPERAIKLCTDANDLVYDPFFGSGTTGIVAEDLNRRWVGTERCSDYLDGAALRFRDRPGFQWAV